MLTDAEHQFLLAIEPAFCPLLRPRFPGPAGA